MIIAQFSSLILATKRARQLNKKSFEQLNPSTKRAASIALDELFSGRIQFREGVETIQETDDELSLDYLMSMNSYDDVADDDS
ncbi:TPA: hypothetical protein EYN98_33140 [Candidatus Poribacteria bacterium]|nr:hypothetical protein [Candidatus Poribacteria bacterium]